MGTKKASPITFHIEDGQLVQTNNNGRVYRCSFDDHENILKFIVSLDEELWAVRRFATEQGVALGKVAELTKLINEAIS